MPVRTFWKGYLKLSLVTCAVAMVPAVSDSEKLRFHTMNRATGNRIQSRFVDSVTGKPVREADEVKGYPRDADDYVMLEDDEIDAVALESTRTIDIELFAPRDSIEWIWYDTPHFLLPNDKVSEEAFAVIREAMKSTGTVGISRVVLYRRERAVMLDARDNGIVLWTLHYGDEVRDEKPYFADIAHKKPDPELQDMIETLIAEKSEKWSPKLMTDPVQDRLEDIIAAKQKKKPKAKARAAPAGDNVIDIMDALKKSLRQPDKK